MSDTLIYSAHAYSVNGRKGHTETRNNVSFDIEMPKAPNGVSREGATTPEDLFAAGYAACFGSALDAVAASEHAQLTNIRISLTVNLVKRDDGYALAAAFGIEAGGVDKKTAEALVNKAHQLCPYSKATRGNIDVSFSVTVK